MHTCKRATPATSFLIVIFLNFSFFLSAQSSAPAKKPRVMNGTAAKAGQGTSLYVTPDLRERVAKFRRVEMPMPTAGISPNEQKMVEKLVEACRSLENIFWRQSDPEALTLYQSLAASTNARDQLLRRYLWINASRFDLIDNNRAFVGREKLPPGRGFYRAVQEQ